MEPLFDVLVYNDLATGRTVPQTAESLTSSDALTWTLKLRPNITFTDGTPYDAAAVKFNWQRVQDPANNSPHLADASTIAALDVVDPLTLRITLKTKSAIFPLVVSVIPYIGSPTAIQSQGASYASNPVGAGPFVLKSWTRDSQMVLVRNPKYWYSPRPYIDQLTLKVITDTSQRVNTFETTGGPAVVYLNTALDAAGVLKAGGVDAHVSQNGGTDVLFNVRQPPFNDLRARQAIVAAIDRTDMINTIDGGYLPPADSAFTKDSPFYDSTILQNPYDPVKAQQLFDQLAAETGGPLTFTLTAFNVNIYPVAAQYIQGALSKYRNIKVSVVLESTATHLAQIVAGNFTAAMTATNFNDPDPLWTQYFSCAGASQNTGFCSADFDAQVAIERTTLDPNQRIAAVKAAQKVFYAQVPGFFFEPKVNWNIRTPSIQDQLMVNDSQTMWDRIWVKH
jgi:peptide/nickel transport system substrate-binding protein